MRNRVALLACLVPALASAQAAGRIDFTESSTPSANGRDDEVINIAECEGTASDTIRLSWTYLATPGANRYYRIFAQTSSTCPTTFSPTGTGVTAITGAISSPTSATGGDTWSTAINVRTDIIVPLGLSDTCSGSGANTPIYFCVVVSGTSADDSTVETAYTAKDSIVINVAKPAAPTSVSARSGDGALTVSWTDGSPAASSFVVTATPADQDGVNCTVTAPAPVTQNCSSSGCRVSNLTNDACYSVTVQGFSAVNNPSPVSAAVTGIPRPVDDFWETYQRAEGVEEGGCSGGPASALALLVLATAAPRLRRRRP